MVSGLHLSLIYSYTTKHPDPSGHLSQVYSGFPGFKPSNMKQLLVSVLSNSCLEHLRSAFTIDSSKTRIKTKLFTSAFQQ